MIYWEYHNSEWSIVNTTIERGFYWENHNSECSIANKTIERVLDWVYNYKESVLLWIQL